MNFSDIVGQKEIISSLTSSIEADRIGHAYIFSGPAGIGKKTVAKIFIQRLLCEDDGKENNCNCKSCSLFKSGSYPDFKIIGQNDDASIGVDEIRKLQGDIIVKPFYSKRKLYLIVDADRMTVQAQNCLLKVLEEPPSYGCIILTVQNANTLLETIRSRAVKYRFVKNTPQEVNGFLIANFGNKLDSIEFITAFSDGIIGNALELSNSEEFRTLREKTTEIVFKISESRLEDIFGIYEFFESNKNSIDNVLDIMLLMYRDMIVSRKSANEILLINSDKKDIILSNARVFSTTRLVKGIEVIEQTRRNIKQNANYQLSIEVMLMKLQEECA